MNEHRYDHIPDQQLLDKFYTERDNQWLGILLQRYTLLLFGVCMKYLKNEEAAKDSVQQIFLKVISDLPKYKVEYFKSWLYMVARNYCFMKLRDKHHIQPLSHDIAKEDEWEAKSEQAEKEKQLSSMQEALVRLSTEQRLCVTMFYLDRKSYQDIANHTGFTLMQVKSFIQNGKRNLKQMMEKNNHP